MEEEKDGNGASEFMMKMTLLMVIMTLLAMNTAVAMKCTHPM